MTETIKSYDFLIIGAGIAGASAAYELSRQGGRVVLCEMEDQPGYHTTGRSAALFTENYGNDVFRGITSASRQFFENPPEGFCQHPLLSKRGELFVADEKNATTLEMVIDASQGGAQMTPLETEQVLEISPALRPETSIRGGWDDAASDIDVSGLLQGFLRGFRHAGGEMVTDAEILSLTRIKNIWQVETRAGTFETPVIVNAAGAWADKIAEMAGTGSVGIVPKRRTAVTFDPGMDIAKWPLTIGADESWYFKPEGGDLMISPADETPSPPCDAQPDEMDIALCIDRIESVTTMKIRRIISKRAGLRSFASDKSPVVGFADDCEGFFWLAGQGGYGIQTAPAMARIVAALANHKDIPDDIAAYGITAAQLSPARFKN